MKFRLSFFALALMAGLQVAQAQDACVQVIQPAVSPVGVCQEFATPCEVPDDWKSVPSCDVIDQNPNSGQPSLEHKMNDRLAQMRAYWQMRKQQVQKAADRRMNDKTGKLGSGSLTRSDRSHRLPTSTNSTVGGIRAFTQKNYDSDTAERYNVKGGYQREGDTTSSERQARRTYRAPIMSRTDANRTGNFKSTVKWETLSEQFTTKKRYGPNPYRLSSKYKEAQKAKRAESNREVDVYERRMSRSRIYRGDRLEGNMSGDDLLKD